MLDNARNKIRHAVVIIQENRSFDSYFGTYPGADGVPAVCVPDPQIVSDGQASVAGLINAIMYGPDWESTAIF